MVLTKKNKLQSTQYLKRYNSQLITACKQYCLAPAHAGQHKATSPTRKLDAIILSITLKF
jgi:hypothetical protein